MFHFIHKGIKGLSLLPLVVTAQKMKFSMKDFFSKCDQIRKKLRIWSNLLKKSLMENFIFCAVCAPDYATSLDWNSRQIEKEYLLNHAENFFDK